MTTREFYESIGASYDSVLVRFGSEKMITKFAKRFADDTTNSQVIMKPRCIHTGAICLLFQFPDVSVVLCDGSVGGEEACLGDVHQHHLLPLLLILVIGECLILYLDVVL